MVIGSERITRCNPFAFYYHIELKRPFYDKDGRLIDPIHQNQKLKTNKNSLSNTFCLLDTWDWSCICWKKNWTA